MRNGGQFGLKEFAELMKEINADIFFYSNLVDKDHYKISEKRKELIDKLLTKYPEVQFTDSINENAVVGTLYYAYSGGCEGRSLLVCATSIASYLFELGSGIGFKATLPKFDYSQISPQLFVGADNSTTLRKHILNFKDLLKFKYQHKLTGSDKNRFYSQARKALDFGLFGENINNELRKIASFIKYQHELIFIFLQMKPQLTKDGFPTEMTELILSNFLGIEMKDVSDIGREVLAYNPR